MKKIFLFIYILLCCLTDVCANEIIHGIDVDKIYESGDWNSKEDIKKLIDDYTLLLQYQDEFDKCPNTLPEVLECYDEVAEKIVTDLYVYPEYNTKEYKQLKKSLSDAYGLKNCRNKYAWPSGYICENNKDSDVVKSLKKYIQDLIDFSKEKMFEYSSILEDYK